MKANEKIRRQFEGLEELAGLFPNDKKGHLLPVFEMDRESGHKIVLARGKGLAPGVYFLWDDSWFYGPTSGFCGLERITSLKGLEKLFQEYGGREDFIRKTSFADGLAERIRKIEVKS